MSDIRIINAYAQALYEIGEKNNVDVAAQLTSIQEMINSNNSLETLLFLDVFTIEEKTELMKELVEKMKISSFVKNFIFFLFHERRFGLFPQVYAKVISIDDDKKGFIKGVIESSQESIPGSVKKKFISFLSEKIGKDVKLEEQKNENISAGYRITVGDLQLDASLENQLEQFKTNILNVD